MVILLLLWRAEGYHCQQLTTSRRLTMSVALIICTPELSGFKVGGSWRFKTEDIDRWIEEKKSKEANK